MAMSMFILAVAAGVAIYRIGQSRDRNLHRSPEQIARERVARLVNWASHGDTTAQVELADAFAEGSGVAQDAGAAAHWNEVAAESGDASAEANLARAYAYGAGVPRDVRQALEWTRKAAEHGNVEAQFNYGVYLFRGVGISQDVVKGFLWLSRAAAAGSNPAELSLDAARKAMTAEQLATAESLAHKAGGLPR